MHDIAERYRNTSYGRFARLILGRARFEELRDRHNNGGPPGAFQSCYADLEAVTSSPLRDPVWCEAMYCLMIAKAWSSDYAAAERLAKELIGSQVSVKYGQIAEKTLKELPRFAKSRERDLRNAEPSAPLKR